MTNTVFNKQFATAQRAMTIASLLVAMAPGMVLAQTSPAMQKAIQDPIEIYKQAGIDPDQESRIRDIVNSYEKEEDAKAHAMIEQLKRMRNMSLDVTLDEKKILETQSNINKLQSEMALDKVHLLIVIRRVLKPNQRIKLVALLRQRNQADATTDSTH